MRCAAKTRKGSRCKNSALKGSRFCSRHINKLTGELSNSQSLYFKDALYYPFIEIPDEGWIKTAVLYWDTISTIVPESIKPYQSKTSEILNKEGILKATFVNPDLPDLEIVTDKVLGYLNSPEGQSFLLNIEKSNNSRVNVEKFTSRYESDLMHNRKFQNGFLHELRRYGLTGKIEGDWIKVPSPFAHYYMTILATHLSSVTGRALLTDTIHAENLATKSTLNVPYMSSRFSRRIPGKLSEGILASFILRTISINRETSIEKIIKFRNKNAVELSRFRVAIRSIVDSLEGDIEVEALASHIDTLYKDNILPAIEELKSNLRDTRISCGYNNLKLSTLFSASPTALGVALQGTPLGPYALAAGIGLSVVLSLANYRMQKRNILRNSPFSYLITAENTFGRS
ncbi:MAG: hypothetical protein DRP65_06425 [Planctomycetota bacterium]|nr:MAG: hypothetical protein DRP65_06425 [Planctomycetota bacterium]